MPHEIDRILGAVAGGVWLIEANKAAEIVNFLALRAGGDAPGWESEEKPPSYAADPFPARSGGHVAVLRLHGTVVPRGGMMTRMSGGASMEQFQKAFREADGDSGTRAIVIDVDSPGGMVDLVPETAAMIRNARRAGRPIIAVANTLAASAAYWVASQADELVVTPSGMVGSIGVMTQRENLIEALKMKGIERELFSKGPRKAEGHPFGPPMDDAARAALNAELEEIYALFVSDVAKARGVPVATVRADPETAEAHFGGGRAYHARQAVRLGMADRVATLEDTIKRAARGRPPRQAAEARRRLALL